MDRYVFPAVFEKGEVSGYVVTFPDLPGCITEGETLDEAMNMARDALQGHIYVMEKEGDKIPAPAPPESVEVPPGAFVTIIEAYMPPIRDAMANKSVNTTITLPRWLKEAAETKGINLSQTLQFALKEQLGIQEKRLS
jgi:predicted RNase H-like HicB family nuclease